jgi:hypothetical protein
MGNFRREIRHYSSRVEIWWAQRQRAEKERRERQLEEGRQWQAQRAEHARKMAAGEIAMPQGWYQHPNEPPGVHRWWNGSAWTDFRQQAGAKRQVAVGASPLAGLPSGTAPGWLKDSAIFQLAGAAIFGPVLVAFMAIGASLASAVAGAAALCIALPIIGWFIGLPLVLMFGFVAASLWASALFGLAVVWALYAAVTFVVALVRNR